MNVCNPKPSDYDAVQRFLEDVYGHDYGFFPNRYPDAWKKGYADFDNVFFLREKGHVVSLLRLFPLRSVQAGAETVLGGIGNVATAFESRGKGYMSLLMDKVVERMRGEGMALSVLWGDRHRYCHFGYETAGSVLSVEVNARGLKKNRVKMPAAVKKYNAEKDVLLKMIDVFRYHSYRKYRRRRDFQELYKKAGIALYYTGDRIENFAYVAVDTSSQSSGRRVYEFGGSACLVVGILGHLYERYGTSSFLLSFPDFSEVPPDILAAASNWSIHPGMMVKILDLKKTLEQFSRQRGFAFPDGHELTLTIKGRESVIIRGKNGVAEISEGRSRNELAFDERAMARLLFGTSFSPPAGLDEKMLNVLRQSFPFKLFVWTLDRI